MRIEQTPLQDCFIIHEKVHGDAQVTLLKHLIKEILMLPQDLTLFLYKTTNLNQPKGY